MKTLPKLFLFLTFAVFFVPLFARVPKDIKLCAKDYLQSPNNTDNVRKAFYMLYDNGGKELFDPTESENTEFLFLCLRGLAKDADKHRFSLRYQFQLSQILNLIFNCVDTSESQKVKLSREHILVLFDALKANMFLMQGGDIELARYIEYVSGTSVLYCEKSKEGFLDKTKKAELVEKWRAKFLEAKDCDGKDASLPLDKDRQAVAYKLFKKACSTYEIYYEGGVCLDGGSLPITITNHVRTYTLLIKAHNKLNKDGCNYEVFSNSNNYYASAELHFARNEKQAKPNFDFSEIERILNTRALDNVSRNNLINFIKKSNDSKQIENIKRLFFGGNAPSK